MGIKKIVTIKNMLKHSQIIIIIIIPNKKNVKLNLIKIGESFDEAPLDFRDILKYFKIFYNLNAL